MRAVPGISASPGLSQTLATLPFRFAARVLGPSVSAKARAGSARSIGASHRHTEPLSRWATPGRRDVSLSSEPPSPDRAEPPDGLRRVTSPHGANLSLECPVPYTRCPPRPTRRWPQPSPPAAAQGEIWHRALPECARRAKAGPPSRAFANSPPKHTTKNKKGEVNPRDCRDSGRKAHCQRRGPGHGQNLRSVGQ